MESFCGGRVGMADTTSQLPTILGFVQRSNKSPFKSQDFFPRICLEICFFFLRYVWRFVKSPKHISGFFSHSVVEQVDTGIHTHEYYQMSPNPRTNLRIKVSSDASLRTNPRKGIFEENKSPHKSPDISPDKSQDISPDKYPDTTSGTDPLERQLDSFYF